MKKLFKYIPILLALLWSCNPMEDVYNDLDDVREPYSEAVEFIMSAEDYNTVSKQALEDATNAEDSAYASAVKSDLSFNEKYTDVDYMRYVLHANYIALNKNSVAKVEYNTTDKPDDLITLEAADQYRLSKEDYALVDEGLVAEGEGFYPGYEAETYMPSILAAGIENPVEGDIVRVNYKYYIGEPKIGYTPVFNETFDDGTLGQFTSVNVLGEDLWVSKSYSADFFAEASGYNAGQCEDWLVSPVIDLSSANDTKFQVNQYVNYLTDWSDLKILISTDYTDNVSTATWEEIVVETKPAGNNHDFVLSELVDLSGYDGMSCYIAFKYLCPSDNATRWRLNDVTVSKKGITAESDTREIFYQYNGSEWEEKDQCLVLSYVDYEMMGSPGNYHNFSSSDAPENYIPTFMSERYPYAQETDMMYIAYRYYANRVTSTKVDKYVFSSGQWMSDSNGPFITVNNQFVHNGTTWMFDPTIKFAMGKADYQMIVDYVKAEINEDYAPYPDGEYYYGAGAKYVNFDLRIKNRIKYEIPTGIEGKTFEDLSEDEAKEVIIERIPEGIIQMLIVKYPDAVTTVGGIDVYYEVTWDSYENDLSRNEYIYKFKCVKSGPSPEFEFIEDISPEN